MFWNFKIFISNFLKDFKALNRARHTIFRHILYLEDGLGCPETIARTASAELWRIFSPNKSPTANRKKDFHTNRTPQESGDDIGFCIKQLKTLHFLIKKNQAQI
jgi:hypothetical protein